MHRFIHNVNASKEDEPIPTPFTANWKSVFGDRKPGSFTILASTNKAFLDFTDNWLESLKRCGIKEHVTIIAEDEEAFQYLSNRTDMKLDVRLTISQKSPSNNLKFGSKDYKELVNKRPNYILDYLKRGIDVFFSDVDIVLLENPFPYFVGDFDVHLQLDIVNQADNPWESPKDDTPFSF
ncbi:uncharacterized protein [Diadema antillarum]|uniref:uncharacterized protein n=1 Tax=Diadema antillarum TaxID=105358 RepID=UPI003A8C149D